MELSSGLDRDGERVVALLRRVHHVLPQAEGHVVLPEVAPVGAVSSTLPPMVDELVNASLDFQSLSSQVCADSLGRGGARGQRGAYGCGGRREPGGRRGPLGPGTPQSGALTGRPPRRGLSEAAPGSSAPQDRQGDLRMVTVWN